MEWHVHVGSHSSGRPALEPRFVLVWLEKPHRVGYLTLIFLNLEGVEGKLQNVDLDVVLNILTSSCHFTKSESRREVHLVDLDIIIVHVCAVQQRILLSFIQLKIIMSGVPESNASSQASRGTKRKWVLEEDAALVSCMVDLHNVGTFNADTGFKAGYLNELERMLQKVLPNAMLKAKPNIESRIRLLKREWSIVYDMLNGQNNSGFGWDEHRQLVVAEDAVWDSYLNSHKEAAQFKHRTFPYYDQLTTIYARDRATGKDAQTAADVLEEINAEGVLTTGMDEERNSFYDCEADVSLDDMDVSAAESQRDRDQGGSSSSNKRKKKSDARDNMYSSFDEAATLLAENIKAVGDQISRSIASEVVVQQKSEEFQIIQEKATNLYSTLWEIEGLTDDERYRALSKIPDHPTQMLVFFSLPSVAAIEWVQKDFFSATIKNHVSNFC
ncbi:hypothetical protein GOBAR_DD18035 [Gossypium barbadense]|nr:hypothetical protein GOBAR_DD18035 [Gossypium barbadense]